MKQFIIGRNKEQDELENIYKSGQAEFVVVYGRRRVGKTFLVREMFDERLSFYNTALSPFEMEKENGSLLIQQQLAVFAESLRNYGDYHDGSPKDWIQAFRWLKELLGRKARKKRLVVFLDELPWMDTPRSGFMTAFEHFWNGWGAGQHNLMLIVCGSASSWINDKLINNTGGLYGRTTREIHLAPFSLQECKQYFHLRNLKMSDYDILQYYMVMGGIPYYMSYVEKGKSLPQNIDNLFFKRKSKLLLEFDRLFKSLFVGPQKYVNILRLLSNRKLGYTRGEIAKKLKMNSGGGLTSLLLSLEACDFIKQYIPFGSSRRNTHYKLTDLFCIFYFNFVDAHKNNSTTFWQDNHRSPTLNAWRGFAFEEVCFSHQECLKKALGVNGVNCEVSVWRNNDTDDHTQIDMVIQRADNVINICEMKFCTSEFEIDKNYSRELNRKIDVFMHKTKTKKTIHLTFVTTYGVKQNTYSGMADNIITMDSLFKL